MVPRFTEFYIPVLEVLSDVENRDINTLIDAVASHVGLSDEDKILTTNSGKQLRYRSNISWAVTDLSQGGFIERSARGVYVITLSGLELLEEKPKSPTRETLASRSVKFKDFMNKEGTRKSKKKTAERNVILKKPESPSGIVREGDADSKCDSDNVSIKELYQTLAILKKAGLSTHEIEAKIKQLEKESVVNHHVTLLIEGFNDFVSKTDIDEPVFVEFHRNHSIKVTIGDFVTVIELKNTIHANQNALVETNINETVNIPAANIVSSGVWFTHHTDQSIALYGDTEPFFEVLKSYGGCKTNHPQFGEGWVFMNGKKEGLENELKQFIIKEPNPTNPESLQGDDPLNEYTSASDDERTYSSEKRHSLISKYTDKLSELKYFNFLGVSGPHKAVLMLSIFQLIRSKTINTPKIYFTEELESRYNIIWKELFDGTPTLGAAYPYAHIGEDTIFHHNLLKPVRDYNITWNRQLIRKYISYTVIDRQLFDLLNNRNANNQLSAFLIKRYSNSFTIPSLSTFLEDECLDNYQEGFIKYLETSTKKNGQSLSKSSISVYVGALKNPILEDLITIYEPSGIIYNVRNLAILRQIAIGINERIDKKQLPNGCRVAINHYIAFINQMNNTN